MMDGMTVDDQPIAPAKKMPGDSVSFSTFIGVLAAAVFVSFLAVSQGSWMLNMLLVVAYALGSLGFASWLIKWVLAKDAGSTAMKQVSEPIREGSEGFLKTQYTMIF